MANIAGAIGYSLAQKYGVNTGLTALRLARKAKYIPLAAKVAKMAYSRFKRSRGTKRRFAPKFKRSVRRRVQRIARRALTEPKTYTRELNGASIDNAAGTSLYSMTTNIVQGTGKNDRGAYRIKLKGLKLRLIFTPNQSDGNNLIRVIVATARHPGTTLTSASFPTDFIGTCPREAVRVHRDMVIPIHTFVTGTSALQKKFIKKWIPFQHMVRYTASTGAASQGDVYVYVISDSPGSTDPTMTGVMRIHFRDA